MGVWLLWLQVWHQQRRHGLITRLLRGCMAVAAWANLVNPPSHLYARPPARPLRLAARSDLMLSGVILTNIMT